MNRDGWLGRFESYLASQDARLAQIEEVRRSLLESDGELDRDVRRAAFAGDDVPEPLAPFVEKIRTRAYAITDEEVADLLASGWSEDQVFELTLSTAAGEGCRRLYAGLRAMGELG